MASLHSSKDGASAKARKETRGRKAKALYFMYVVQELLDELSSRNGPKHLNGILQEPHLPSSPLPPLMNIQNKVTSLRMVLTNREMQATLSDGGAAVEASIEDIRESLAASGLSDNMRDKLRRVRPKKFDLVHQILPGLVCGGWAALHDDCRMLRRYGVTHILSIVSAEIQRRLPGFVTKLVTCGDTVDDDLGQHFPSIVAFIDAGRRWVSKENENRTGGRTDRKGVVYVHCGAGISRAPTACTAYIMHASKLRLREAFTIVKEHRPCARPNPAFVEQLRAWEAGTVEVTA